MRATSRVVLPPNLVLPPPQDRLAIAAKCGEVQQKGEGESYDDHRRTGTAVRFVESEIRSEKDLSHAVLQQSVRNGATLNVLRSEVGATVTRVDQLAADMAAANAALRNDVTALRRGQEELHARFDELLAAIRAGGGSPPA
jgi:hypothetical protein